MHPKRKFLKEGDKNWVRSKNILKIACKAHTFAVLRMRLTHLKKGRSDMDFLRICKHGNVFFYSAMRWSVWQQWEKRHQTGSLMMKNLIFPQATLSPETYHPAHAFSATHLQQRWDKKWPAVLQAAVFIYLWHAVATKAMMSSGAPSNERSFPHTN